MALEAAVLAELRSLVGSQPADADLEERFTRLGTVSAVVLEVLRQRLADMLAQPLKFAVDEDASWDWGSNVKVLRERIAEVEAGVVGGPDDLTITTIMRGGARR